MDNRASTLNEMSNITKKDKDILLSYLSSSVAASFSVLPPKKRHELSHKQNDIIIACKFHGLPCEDAFKLLLSPQFLNCYTFTGFEKTLYSVGVENGLSLILKEDEFSWDGYYIDASNIQNTEGLRITIHEPHTIPNLFDNSLELVPGYSTTVSLQQKNMERINTPKSKCMTNSWIDQKSGTVPDFRSTSFSCLLQCEIKYVWDRCGCKPAIMPDLYPLEDEENHLQCAFANQSDKLSLQEMLLKMNCQLKRMEELNTIQQTKPHPPCVAQCDWECNSIEYAMDVSYSRWPVKTQVHDFLDKYVSEKSNQIIKDYRKILRYKYNGSFDQHYKQEEIFTYNDAVQMSKEIMSSASTTEMRNELLTNLGNKTMIPSINSQYLNLSSVEQAEIKWVKDSFYKLNIYFKEPVVQIHRQVLDYGPADFWSALGGILGLWAGVSIITVIELLEFMGHLLKAVSEKVCITDISLANRTNPALEKK